MVEYLQVFGGCGLIFSFLSVGNHYPGHRAFLPCVSAEVFPGRRDGYLGQELWRHAGQTLVLQVHLQPVYPLLNHRRTVPITYRRFYFAFVLQSRRGKVVPLESKSGHHKWGSRPERLLRTHAGRTRPSERLVERTSVKTRIKEWSNKRDFSSSHQQIAGPRWSQEWLNWAGAPEIIL